MLCFMVSFTPLEFGYQRSRWNSEVLSIVLREALNIVLNSSMLVTQAWHLLRRRPMPVLSAAYH